MIHSLSHRRLGAIGVMVAIVAALVATVSPAGARASTPTCSSNQLVETINSLRDGGTAGTDYYQLRFTNLGGTCELRGYPGVSAVDLSGHQMGRPAVRSGGREREITLRAATSDQAYSATEYIGFVDTGAISDCHQRLAAGLRIYTPGSTAAKYVPFVFDTCTTGSLSDLKLEPIS